MDTSAAEAAGAVDCAGFAFASGAAGGAEVIGAVGFGSHAVKATASKAAHHRDKCRFIIGKES